MRTNLDRSARDVFAKTAKLIGSEYDIDLLSEKYYGLYQRLVQAVRLVSDQSLIGSRALPLGSLPEASKTA